MSPWPDIVSAALVGTSRKPWTPPADPLLQAASTDDPAKSLLRAAAILSLQRRAGQLVATVATAPEEAPPDAHPACNPDIARYFRTMIEGRFAILLPLALGRLATKKKRLPHDLLPALFDRAKAEELRSAARAVCDERGRWLARQNPAWGWVIPAPPATPDSEALWQTGSLDERVAALTAVRAQDPPKARELLESTWSADKADHRAKFLDAFATGLGPDDEPFLESRLDDRSIVVRRAAANLLSLIPGSALVQRMEARIRAIVSLQRKGLLWSAPTLEVQLPETLDASLLRDGVKAQGSTQGVGEKASIAMQILAMIPPARFATIFQMIPSELLKAAEKGEWKALLWTGWLTATERSRDADWAKAFADALPFDKLNDAVLGLLTVEQRDAVYRKYLESNSEDVVLSTLARMPGPWSRPFTLALLQRARKATPMVAPYVGSWLTAALPKMPNIAPEEVANEWPHSLHDFVTGLEFKRALWREMEN
jgi:hypothetical protein